MVRKRIPNLPTFTFKTPNLGSGSNLKACPTASPFSDKKTFSSSQYKTIFLHDWWLVKPHGKGLAVEGVASIERLGERVVTSSPIAKRHETNVLETQDGITFIITGFINKSRTNENGFTFEVCRRFLLGFPHDWEEYKSYDVGKQHHNRNVGLDDSSTCPLKNACKIADLLTNKGDLNCSLLLNKFLNDSVGSSPKNVSEQSEPSCNREPDIKMNTDECQVTEDTIPRASNVQVDQMNNIENGYSAVILEAQGKNPNAGLQSGMNMSSLKASQGLLGNGADKAPASLEVKKNGHGSSVHKQKKSEDVTIYCRRITRSISKTSQPVRSPIPINSNIQDDDQTHNVENGVSDAALEAQGENASQGLQSVMNISSLKSKNEGLTGKRTDTSSYFSEKTGKYPRSSSCKRKKSEDHVDFSFRRITRSMSKLLM